MARSYGESPRDDEDDEGVPSDVDELDPEWELAQLNEAYSDPGSELDHVAGRRVGRAKGKARAVLIDSGDEGEDDDEDENGQRKGGEANGQAKAGVRALEAELASVRSQIRELVAVEAVLLEDLSAARDRAAMLVPALSRPRPTNGAGSSSKDVTDYSKGEWPWSKEMRQTMEQVWGFKNFRLCQEGVCNAVLDDRDVVVLMPTGGGKSACYQLPAVLTPGKTTLVVSPLVSLMTDQLLHLQEAGVEAVMFNAATPQLEAVEIMHRLVRGTAKGKVAKATKLGGQQWEDEPEIKLCYVTPEKLAKSKTFMSTLQKMYENDRLARVIVDEAHCCSQMGYDFRPDYRKLSIIKASFPDCPIVALTATCPPHVLKDVLRILKMPSITDGTTADRNGTVYFSSPLYRPNLRYQVLPKPASPQGSIDQLAQWILKHHPGEQGIVYTLSQKDTATVADGLRAVSKGKIKTGVYNASLDDDEKARVHMAWRSRKIHTVVATIAFGMGIDAPHVRYVLHHTLSKSIDGYYQESGRAGRDGKEADCVLFYRNQDSTRLSALGISEADAAPRLFRMVGYCLDLQTCRKLAFEEYFSSPSTSANSFSAEDGDAGQACGSCDNCTRGPSDVEEKDAGAIVWKILKVAKEVQANDGRVTLAQLTDLCRGVGGTSFTVGGGKGKAAAAAAKVSLDLEAVAAGKVELPKEDVERLLMKLVVDGHLDEQYVNTAYNVNVYLQPGTKAARFTRFNKHQMDAGDCPAFPFAFLSRRKGKKTRKATGAAAKKNAGPQPGGKRGRVPSSGSDSEGSDGFEQLLAEVAEDDVEDGGGDGVWSTVTKAGRPPEEVRRNAAEAAMKRASVSQPSRQAYRSRPSSAAGPSKKARLGDLPDVIDLS